jgi:hypothetical protein
VGGDITRMPHLRHRIIMPQNTAHTAETFVDASSRDERNALRADD